MASTPRLSNDQAFNLCYNSLNYWWYEAKILKGVLEQERLKLQAYEKITGVQANSIEDLERVYKIQSAEKEDMRSSIENLEGELKKANSSRKAWKVGTFVLPPAALIGGIILGVKISK